jgi:hypothetical protein
MVYIPLSSLPTFFTSKNLKGKQSYPCYIKNIIHSQPFLKLGDGVINIIGPCLAKTWAPNCCLLVTPKFQMSYANTYVLCTTFPNQGRKYGMFGQLSLLP